MDKEQPKTFEEQEAFVRECYERAEQLRRKKAHAVGIDLLVDALQYGLHKEKLYYRLGNLYFDGGDLARAEYAYKRALHIDPRHVNAMHNLAIVYKRQKKISLFVKTYKKSQRMALRHAPRVELTPRQRKRLHRVGLRTLLVVLTCGAVLVLVLYLLLR